MEPSAIKHVNDDTIKAIMTARCAYGTRSQRGMCDFRKPAELLRAGTPPSLKYRPKLMTGVIARIRMPRYRSESENIGVVMNFTS